MNPVDTNAAANNNKTMLAMNLPDTQILQSLMAQAQGEQAPSGPPALSATPTMAGLWQALVRRWPIALGVAVGATVLAVAAVFFVMPPLYQTNIRIRVAKQVGSEDVTFAIFTANMEALVKSPLVLSAALNDKTADGRDIKDLELVRAQGLGVIDWLEKELKTDYKLGPEVLRVTLASDQPQDAAELLNAIAKAFFNEYAQMESAKKQQRLAELRGKKERIEDDLRGLRNTLAKTLERMDIKGLEQAAMQLQQLQNQLIAAEADKRGNDNEILRTKSDIETCKARLKNLDKQAVPDAVLYELFSRDGSIQACDKRMAELDVVIAECYRKFNEPYATQEAAPLRRDKTAIQAKREERENELKPKIEQTWRKQTRDDLENQIAIGEEKVKAFEARRVSLRKEIVDLEKKAKDAGSGLRPPQIVAIEEKIELAKKSLESTAQKINDVELDAPGSRIILMDRAAVPLEKDRTRQTKIAGAGGLAVFFFALFGMAFLEFRSRRIGVAEEVSGMGLKVLGSMPALPRNSKTDAAATERWQARLNESVDAIRTVILHQARSESLHVLMVTSAQSAEGKTTLATQLAGSLARAWKRTLVIDADLRHPAAHALFDVPQEPGLAEVLRGEIEPADAVRATPFARLWLLPAGNGDAHAIQALAQDNVRTLFEQLKQQYDFIIIDTPPVLPVTDTLLLGQHVDGLVYAVLSEVSRAPALHAAQQKLAPLGVRTLGAVILGAKAEFDEKNYAYAMGQAK